MRKDTTFLRPLPGLGKQLKAWDQIPCVHFIAHMYKKLTKRKRFISNPVVEVSLVIWKRKMLENRLAF